MPSSLRFITRLIAGAYLYGTIIGALALAWDVAFGDGAPQWAPWQYALAPLGIGLLALGGEWLVERVQSTTGWGRPGLSRGRHALHLVILVVVLAVLVIGPAIYRIAHS